MSTLFAGPVDSAYGRSITPLKADIGVDNRSPFEVVMDSVVRRLADPWARLSSPRTINVLSGLIARAERTLNTADLKSSLIAVWKALLVVAETPAHNQSLAVRRQLVVALAKMLCSPVRMPLRQRQRYWEIRGRRGADRPALPPMDGRPPLSRAERKNPADYRSFGERGP